MAALAGAPPVATWRHTSSRDAASLRSSLLPSPRPGAASPRCSGAATLAATNPSPSWISENKTTRVVSYVARASADATTADASSDAAGDGEELAFARLKDFLADLAKVGRVRIIVNTGMGVLESVTTLEGLFFTPWAGKGEYGNVMKSVENVDFHLLLPEVARVQLVTAKSRAGDFNTHTARFYDKEGKNGASIFVMWKPGTKGEYDPGQVEAFQGLVEKHGAEVAFL